MPLIFFYLFISWPITLSFFRQHWRHNVAWMSGCPPSSLYPSHSAEFQNIVGATVYFSPCFLFMPISGPLTSAPQLHQSFRRARPCRLPSLVATLRQHGPVWYEDVMIQIHIPYTGLFQTPETHYIQTTCSGNHSTDASRYPNGCLRFGAIKVMTSISLTDFPHFFRRPFNLISS